MNFLIIKYLNQYVNLMFIKLLMQNYEYININLFNKYISAINDSFKNFLY